VEQILNELEQYLISQGGEVLYTDFIAQIDGPARVNVVNAARNRFKFSLRLEGDKMVHYVGLRD